MFRRKKLEGVREGRESMSPDETRDSARGSIRDCMGDIVEKADQFVGPDFLSSGFTLNPEQKQLLVEISERAKKLRLTMPE